MGIGGVTMECSVEGTVSAMCTASGDLPAEESGAPAQNTAITMTLTGDDFQYTQIPVTGEISPTAAPSTGASATATSTGSSTKQIITTAGSTSSGTGPSPGQASPTGTTGGAASLERSSMVALVGAAALAAVLL
ncbi:MAG: hypothetical protein Q9209_003417 [Squamulea sp. 1 TL-2023]